MAYSETAYPASLHTRFWTEAVDYGTMYGLPKLGQAFFGEYRGVGGRTRFVTDASHVDFDVRDGNQRTTTLVHRGVVGQPLNRDMLVDAKFTSFSRAFPLAEQYGIVSADQLLGRQFGEMPYSPDTQKNRARKIATNILEDMVRRSVRMNEVLAIQMLKTGKMDTIIGTTNTAEQLDTKRLSAMTITIGTTWATDTTDILGDHDSVADKIMQNSGHICDGVIVGAKVPGYHANNAAIKAFANMAGANGSGMAMVYFGSNFRPAQKFSKLIEAGANPICQLITPKGRTINMFTYEGGYKDSGGTWVPYFGDDEVLWFSSDAACDRYFGPAERLPMTMQERQDYLEIFGFSPDAAPVPPMGRTPGGIIVPESFYPDVYRESNDAKAFTVRLQSAPMFIARDTNAFAYAADCTP